MTQMKIEIEKISDFYEVRVDDVPYTKHKTLFSLIRFYYIAYQKKGVKID